MKTLVVLGVIAALLVVVVQWRAYAREARAEASYPPSGQMLNIEGAQVHAIVMGEGPDLVLLHGAGGNTRDFTFAFADMAKEQFRVIILDRPGLGWTSRADTTYEGAWNTLAESPAVQARLLSAAARELGAERPIVLGHSFGGIVALAWALEHDPAAIVSIGGVANPWPGDLGWLYQTNSSSVGGALFVPLLTAFAPKSLVDNTVGSIFAPARPPEGYLEHVGVGLSLRRVSIRANARQVNFLKPYVIEMAKDYDSLTLPIELVHGALDRIVPKHVHAEPLSQRLDNAHLTIIENAGHMPHHTHPAVVMAAVERAAERAGLR